MNIRGIGRVKRVLRKHFPHLFPGSAILLYHSIADVQQDPWDICVSPNHFEEHMQILRRFTSPQQIQDISSPKFAKSWFGWPIAVTFDDGYWDNLACAVPILEKYEIPATIFVSTGKLFNGGKFWWDTLEDILLQPGYLPSTLGISINGNQFSWILSEASYYSSQEAQKYSKWRAWQTPPTSRHALYQNLYNIMKPLGDHQQQTILKGLSEWAGFNPNEENKHRVLSALDIKKLNQSPTITIGAHTVTHPNLATLGVPEQLYEIQQSKKDLESLVNQPITSFAYTFGAKSDYTLQTVALASQAGFQIACTNSSGLVDKHTDNLQLTRFQVHNWNGREFLTNLKSWFSI